MASSFYTNHQPEAKPASAFHGIVATLPSTSAASTLPYDVFINHRGIDVKRTMASTIYHTLSNIGYQVFLDEEKLQLGDYLPVAIEEAVRKALLHIAIFSKNYAQSPWCLAELALILETGTKIIPVFYYVQPDDLRWAVKGKGKYAHSFFQHELKGRYTFEQLQRWKMALHKASFYSGHIINSDEDERRLLKTIVNCVLNLIRKVPFEVAKHPVGLNATVEDFEKTTLQSTRVDQSVQIVGIWGMGGSGKTTLAKDLYNRRYSSLERSSFLFDVRDAASKGLLHNKQIKLLDDLGIKDETLDNIEQGKGILARRLRSARVFIVLDDVDHISQLDALLPPRGSLGWGSLIIVTTREREVLTCWGISCIYKMRALNEIHAKQLFCWHAFLRPCPVEGFEKLVEKFVKVCDGLPLSLRVFGAQLYGKSNKDYWESQLQKIVRILPADVKNRLKVSYDALDYEEKEAFLDAACFFIGEEKSLAIEVWEGSKWSGLCSLETLVNRCLLEVDEMDCIKMHDHFRDLGREISSQQSPYRLWLPHQLTVNFEKHVEIEYRVREIATFQEELGDYSSYEELMVNRSQGISTLVPFLAGLKIIVFKGPNLNQLISEASKELLWLRWFEIGQRNLPSRPSLKSLRVLELYEVVGGDHHLEELWKDSSDAPIQLRELVISGCTEFQRLPESIGSLKHLKKIVVDGGQGGSKLLHKLKSLPREFCLLQSLEHLELRGCQLSSLPDSFGDLSNLQHLYLSGCRELRRLPASFKKLTLLRHLLLEGFYELTMESDIMEDMTKLENLSLSHCTQLEELPCHITNQASLTELLLSNTYRLRELPVNIGQLSKLRELHIESDLLTSLPTSLGDLCSLNNLTIMGCRRLECLPDSLGRLKLLENLALSSLGIKSLPKSVGQLVSLRELKISGCPVSELELGAGSSPGSLCNLEKISIERTELSKISISEGCCPSLNTLYLYHNDHLTEIQVLSSTVRHVTLACCEKVRNIRGIVELVNIQTLCIEDCPEMESEIESEMDALPSFLKSAWLRYKCKRSWWTFPTVQWVNG
ncbi:disease resistance protein RUN1 isoform X2 [Cryptomeria japonica]|uniref:disease resistance protein RUN1 isoform X2 n=1 Tax=Cryptomeria japonica TaxID=3369 RepID=UPI0027D9FC58|nr:disease resistance protein RUN1 isoform X2 [Cryptomeria japonica]